MLETETTISDGMVFLFAEDHRGDETNRSILCIAIRLRLDAKPNRYEDFELLRSMGYY